MSTCEVFNQRAACSCGSGFIRRKFYSPDNPYSTPYSGEMVIECLTCAPNWVALREEVLVSKKGEERNSKMPTVFRPDWKFC